MLLQSSGPATIRANKPSILCGAHYLEFCYSAADLDHITWGVPIFVAVVAPGPFTSQPADTGPLVQLHR